MLIWVGAAVATVACGHHAATTTDDQNKLPQQVVLAISVSGEGAVRAQGVECKSACTQRLPVGTHLVLEAAPNTGANFSGWGGACSGNGACQLTLDADKSVTAAFQTPPPPGKARLTVLVDGHGSVRSAPAGIDCGATCMASFDAGSAVSLTAAADAGFRFAGWSGACGGQGGCSVTMSGDTQLSARFEALPPPPPENRRLTVTLSGPGAVRSTPAGIDCGPLCNTTLTAGTSITLVAAPASGARFMGWTGACMGISAVCTILLSGDAAVAANFEMEAVTLSDGLQYANLLALNSSEVFWNAWNGNAWEMRAVSKNGGEVRTVVVTQGWASSLLADDDALYYVGFDNTGHVGVYRAAIRGGAPQWLAEAGAASQLAMDDSFLYFTHLDSSTTNTGTVMQISKSGGTLLTLVGNVIPTGVIAADGTHVWFVVRQNGMGSALWRVPKAGGSQEGFISCSCNFVQLRLDPQNYYLRDDAGVLRSAPKRLDGAVRIFPGQNNDGGAGNIDVNASVVYWTANYYSGYSWQQPNGIWRANADGSDRRQISTPTDNYFRSVRVDDAHIFYVGDSKLVRRLK
jgi:hypothetical protein